MRPGRAADHSPPSSTAVMEEYSYTSTHPLGHTGLVTGTLYFYLYIYIYIYIYIYNTILLSHSQPVFLVPRSETEEVVEHDIYVL